MVFAFAGDSTITSDFPAIPGTSSSGMSLRDDFFFAGARFRNAAAGAATARIVFFARGLLVRSAMAPSLAAGVSTLFRGSGFAGFARFAAVVVLVFFFVAIYQCTVTLSPLRPSSR